MKRISSKRNKELRPVPLSIDEFAREVGVDRSSVLQMIDSGELKTVWVGVHKRVPFHELRRLLNEALDQKEEVQMAISSALQSGLCIEVGLDEEGSVVYRRTARPRPGDSSAGRQ